MKSLVPLLFLFGCSHDLPIAELDFTKNKKNDISNDYYDLYFSSNIELKELLSDNFI